MPRGRIPSIFISSTCFDLGQVRRDLKETIENLGYEPVLSEYDSFPIDPNEKTVDNCLRVVENRADVFILVIGGRYGSTNEAGKSITNLEYLKARSKGIPIYVFIQKNILTILPLWKDNQKMDFKQVVDSTKLFEFVESIMTDSRWVHSFESAQDISQTIKKQLAYLFSESLHYLNLINVRTVNNIEGLNGEALRIILERPKAWKYKLYSEVLSNGIKQCEIIRNDMRYGITYGNGQSFSVVLDCINWIVDHINKLDRIVSNLNKLFNEILPTAVGAPGEPVEPNHIIYATNKIVECYQQSINWCLDCNSVIVDEELQPLVTAASGFSFGIVDELEKYSIKVKNEVEKIRFLIEGQTMELDLTLKINSFDLNNFTDELEKLRQNYGL